ncbi:unnamed protein product [Ilex paraguariensis]|uniref:RING-type E3 ubiquitin transferase n=1 Tax=Ilex paraguariensis TaxID=185542 RepID=A0ABC8TP06_9AQUA
MMSDEEPKQSPENGKYSPPKQPDTIENGEKIDTMLSPGFRSVAAMAGWDEETLLIASSVVEDTPDRGPKQTKRPDLHFKTPPTNSRRKRRAAQRKSPVSTPVEVLNLDEDESTKEECVKTKTEPKIKANEFNKTNNDEESIAQGSGDSCSSSAIPCMDKLREELSCAICLEICFEPSTTPCGHSFCKKCLRSAADKCGKRCPKCRQLISNGRSCTVNTVLWNTIQLLFPQEIQARKAAAASKGGQEAEELQSLAGMSRYNVRNRTVLALESPEAERQVPERRSHHRLRNQGVQPSEISSRGGDGVRRRREVPSQDEDAALALRLQREEFMDAYRGGTDEQYRSSFTSARANLRAMASRAINVRLRGRPT